MVSEILGFLLNKGGGAWLKGVPGWCHWVVSEILEFLLNKRGGAWPQGVPGWCHWMCQHKEQEYIWLRGGDLKGF